MKPAEILGSVELFNSSTPLALLQFADKRVGPFLFILKMPERRPNDLTYRAVFTSRDLFVNESFEVIT